MAHRSVTERLDGFQRRHARASFPLAVLYKFLDDQGSYLAALMTHYAFVSLFPLLLLLTSILGLVLPGHPALQQQILDSTLSQIPVIGTELGQPKRLGGGVAAIVIGSLTALYGSLGVAQALQNAMNQIWAVPRNRRPNPITGRLRGLLLILIAGLAVLATSIVSAIGSVQSVFGLRVGGIVPVALIVGSMVLNTGIVLVVFRIATAHPLTVRQSLPGAVTAALLWQLLQTFGAQYVRRVVKDASASTSISAVVLGLLAFLFLAANALVLSMEINVVLERHLYPRALLTPFTENVDLTEGDKATYTGTAQAQRSKDAERVEVSFHPDAAAAADPDADPDAGPAGESEPGTDPEADPGTELDPGPLPGLEERP